MIIRRPWSDPQDALKTMPRELSECTYTANYADGSRRLTVRLTGYAK